MKLISSLLTVSILFCNSVRAQTKLVDLARAKQSIAKIIQQFSADFHNGDSVALGNLYAKNATFGSIKGRDKITAAWGSYIRNRQADGYNDVVYHTNAMATDGEFVLELGDYKMVDANKKVVDSGKYCVVWKQEDGQWKLYRDMGL